MSGRFRRNSDDASGGGRSAWLAQQTPASRRYFVLIIAIGVMVLVASALDPRWQRMPWPAVAGWCLLAVLASFSTALQLRRLADGAPTVTLRDVWPLAALLIWGLPGALVVNLVVVVWSETVVKVWLEGRTFVLARLGFNAALPTIALAAAWLVLRLNPGDWLVWLLAGAVFEVVTVVVVELHTMVNGGPRRLSRSALMLVAMCATEIPLAAAITVLWFVSPLLSATMAATIFVAAVGLHYILEFIELRDLVQTDHRTGLLTPTAWRDSAERTLRQQPLAILMADLDHFKRLNDSHGHLIGDSILQQVGNILLSSIRPVDLACRWGGEEFVLMLVGTTEADAVEVAERIRRRVGAEAVSNGAGITISIGVATCRPVPLEQLAPALTATIGQADDALYRAKRDGRNRVVAEGADIR
jgi:diguanylate cyclase (GGDEF)-like protein